MYEQINERIFISDNDSFNISEILECGQCFRFEKIGESEYKIIAFERILIVKQTKDGVWFNGTTAEDFEEIWTDYFDLKMDYDKIKRRLSEHDEVMKNAIGYAGGIRILNQDPWECLISFIISQNNRIPQIKQVIKNISERYGSKICDDTYSFPTVQQLIDVPVDDFLECKTGFRAKYIRDAVVKAYTGEIDFEALKLMKTGDMRNSLMSISGVGPKVSDCVILFSLGRREVFPIDVWVGKIMRHYYFDNREVKLGDIHKLAYEKYESYAGYAQQYLFHYARNNLV